MLIIFQYDIWLQGLRILSTKGVFILIFKSSIIGFRHVNILCYRSYIEEHFSTKSEIQIEVDPNFNLT
jgi:hypothetical protein